MNSLPSRQTKPARRIISRLRNRRLTPLYYMLPTIIPVLVLTLYPFLSAIRLAFTKYDQYSKDSTFVGLDNFVELFSVDDVFWLALRNNLFWTVGIVVLAYGLAFLTSLALNEIPLFQGLFRGIALIPWVCPAVVAALTWRWIYDPNFGMLNYTLVELGLIQSNIGWLSNRNTALLATMIVVVWKLLPFMIVMLLAGLQSIPLELYEAASIDGANILSRLRHITVPLLNRIGSIAILLCIIYAFNHFDTVYVLTGGGPGNRTMLLSTLAYQNAFVYFKIGYASAIGVVMLFVIMLPMTLYMRWLLQDLD